jgi:hypothetical protein
MIGIGLIPTLSDFLPVGMGDWIWDWLMGRPHPQYYRIIPVETGMAYPGDAFVGVGVVVLIAGVILRRYGR